MNYASQEDGMWWSSFQHCWGSSTTSWQPLINFHQQLVWSIKVVGALGEDGRQHQISSNIIAFYTIKSQEKESSKSEEWIYHQVLFKRISPSKFYLFGDNYPAWFYETLRYWTLPFLRSDISTRITKFWESNQSTYINILYHRFQHIYPLENEAKRSCFEWFEWPANSSNAVNDMPRYASWPFMDITILLHLRSSSWANPSHNATIFHGSSSLWNLLLSASHTSWTCWRDSQWISQERTSWSPGNVNGACSNHRATLNRSE